MVTDFINYKTNTKDTDMHIQHLQEKHARYRLRIQVSDNTTTNTQTITQPP